MALLSAIIAISGCAFGPEQQKPVLNGHSTKMPAGVNRCLVAQWQHIAVDIASSRTDSGYRIAATRALVGTVALALVRPRENGGTDVAVYALSKGMNRDWAETAVSCL
ncbi:hypothetical protein [Entomohabitans teleogrylli]|uniref:hypothetical protein n=1 Tax=Entomohabitans teleogrylli TaxID=1384589 RepID=UPI00073D9328|nr:hypothetical protein [Entomohabitans teleogrylli]